MTTARPFQDLISAARAFREARIAHREATAKAQPEVVGDAFMDAALDAEDDARKAATVARKALCDAAEALFDPSDSAWQRGDLVLVDGDKEGCVLSVNGTVAQVSMWAAQAAVVNVSRLSPLEQSPKQYVSASEDGTGFYRAPENDHNAGLKQVSPATLAGLRLDDTVLDASPPIRCKPEVGVVLDSPDGPILTVDPLDGGNVWEVNIGDVVAWHEAHKAPPSFMERLDAIETQEASVATDDGEDGSL